ncbi:hypothetical protein HN51_023851 [Arachis hypogaea]|uniref:Transcription factor PAR1 n=1 Tax=Arachis duranensis TaxID=130453 RepID=A0A6P4DSX2_ARADU|nr:transcription factor PAR1 [Arachis duranensis]XP_025608676.1 transcription factor PAR1-like [Arachis hypogaea]XP_025608677.1 transcription factor PAR1-like [Arachis hypogaea]QHO26814.1 Transcription factor [Arachis hypogaea]
MGEGEDNAEEPQIISITMPPPFHHHDKKQAALHVLRRGRRRRREEEKEEEEDDHDDVKKEEEEEEEREEVEKKIEALKKIVPGGESVEGVEKLFDETAGYILSLRCQLNTLRALAAFFHNLHQNTN